MTRRRVVVGLLLVPLACGLLGPSSQFEPLTGKWAGWCCPEGPIHGSAAWYLTLAEDSSGDLTGTVEESVGRGVLMQPRLSSGTVTGERRGLDVELYLTYEDGRRGLFKGEQVSDSLFRGRMAGWNDGLVGFERTP